MLDYLEKNKKKSYTLKGLRELWEQKNSDDNNKDQIYNKVTRIYCKRFLQKEALSYFLTFSRTKNPFTILKYRSTLLRNLKNPEELTFLKKRE